MGSQILRTISGVIVALFAVLSVFFLIRGHDAPGGGFVGGLLLAAGLAVRLLSHGPRAARRALRVDPRTLTGLGLGLVTIAAWIGPVVGRAVLEPVEAGEIPGVGTAGTVLLFDLGVYLLVAGAATTFILTIAEEEP